MPFPEDVVTVRIPELPEHIALSNLDQIAVWSNTDNKTRHTTLQTLREFIETGDTGTFTPAVQGDTIIYEVPFAKEGDDYVSIPAIAGMNFSLERDGYPLIPYPKANADFEILSAGGFRLLNTTLVENQRYKLEVYELSYGAPVTPSGGSGSGFIAGEVPVNTNVNISVNDLNKIHQVRGGSNKLTINLPDVSQCPAKSFLILECLINNQYQHSITTTGGQYIYMDNDSKTLLYLGKGEYLWLYPTADGWFVISSKGNFSNLGMPKAAYKVGLNQILCDGNTLNRVDYPRLWEYAQTLGASIVTDATWNTVSVTHSGRTIEKPYRGCFSQGNGTTTFRVPDLMNMALRGLKNIGGSDTERYFNNPGGFSKNIVGPHNHNDVPLKIGDIDRGGLGSMFSIDNNGKTALTGDGIGTETIMDNIGMLWVIDY